MSPNEEVQALQILGGWMGWDVSVADLLDRHQPGESVSRLTSLAFRLGTPPGDALTCLDLVGTRGHSAPRHT